MIAVDIDCDCRWAVRSTCQSRRKSRDTTTSASSLSLADCYLQPPRLIFIDSSIHSIFCSNVLFKSTICPLLESESCIFVDIFHL